MTPRFCLITLAISMILTSPVFAEPTSPVTTGISWGQAFSLILTIIGTGAGTCYAAYRIIRNQSKDLKDDFNQRFDDFNQRFSDFNQQFNSRFDRIEAQLGQLNQNFIEGGKNHN